MKISARVREEACRILSIAACGGVTVGNNGYWSTGFSDIAAALGFDGPYGSSPASRLAYDARDEMLRRERDRNRFIQYISAEAESLLRAGWSPP